MTYNAQEASQRSGSPVELYLFTRGVTNWRYTSADEVQTYLQYDYAPAPIIRSEIEDLAELNRSALKVDVPRDFPVSLQFVAYPPGEVVTLKIFRRHRTDVDSEIRVIWIGRILSAQWADGKTILNCEPITTSLKRTGLRRRYGRQCGHDLYGTNCKVVAADYSTIDTVTAINGNVMTVPAAAGEANGYFNGGFLWWQFPDGRRDARMIIAHTGDQVTLAATMPDVSVGDSVQIYPGCDHTLNHCNTRFGGNENNHGGFMFTPKENPFGGKTLY